MLRLVPILLMSIALAACQSTGFPRPQIPAGASVDEENRILCRQPRASPWWVPCNDMILD